MQLNDDANPCNGIVTTGPLNNDQSQNGLLLQSEPLTSLTASGRNPEDTSSALGIVTSSSFPAANETEVSIKNRELICDDALVWLNSFADDSLPGCVFTSLPDISEVPDVAQGFKEADRFRAYKQWFTNAAALLMSKMKIMTYAVFLQSDIRVILGNSQITEWVDKSHLLCNAADRTGCTLMWHKIVLLSQGATARQGLGRPLYSHLLCFGKGPVTYRSGAFASPDVFDRGHMLWPRAIGLDSCFLGLTFLKEVALAKCVIDPFCGVGTVCAMANALGMASIGVELSTKRCRKAKQLSLQDFVNNMEFKRKCFLGHKPDKVKEGKLAYKKRMEEDLASSAAALDVGEAAHKGKVTPSSPAILPHNYTLHHNDDERLLETSGAVNESSQQIAHREVKEEEEEGEEEEEEKKKKAVAAPQTTPSATLR